MNKRRTVGVLFFALLLVLLWVGIKCLDTPIELEGELVITAFSVGKADALLVQTEEQVIMIDTGEEADGPYLVRELTMRGISKIDLLLITHFDKDHVGGAAYLVDHLEVASVRMPDYEGDRPEYQAFLKSLEGHSDVARLSNIYQYTAGALSCTIYPAEDPEEILDMDDEYDNDLSLVASLTYQDSRFLLTGDIEKTRIAQMLESDIDWQHDWIKMPHHGRYQKALKKLLEAVQPNIAVICCSEEEYAEEKTLDLLKEQQVEVWDTAKESVVTIYQNGKITVTNRR